MSVRRPGGQPGAHQIPGHRLHRKLLRPDDVGGDADVPHPDLPGPEGAVPHEQTDLGQGEGDGEVGPHRLPRHPAGVRLHPGGQVGGHHLRLGAVDEPGGGGRRLPQGGAQPHPEQGVHDDVGPEGKGGLPPVAGVEVLKGPPHGLQPPGHLPVVVGELVPAARQEHPDLPALPEEDAGGGGAVPAVVARPHEDGGPPHPAGDVPAIGKGPLAGDHLAPGLREVQALFPSGLQPLLRQLPDRVGHALRRPLHEGQRGDAPLPDGPLVHPLHLFRRGQPHVPDAPLSHFPPL